jgi:hypothetical protein
MAVYSLSIQRLPNHGFHPQAASPNSARFVHFVCAYYNWELAAVFYQIIDMGATLNIKRNFHGSTSNIHIYELVNTWLT